MAARLALLTPEEIGPWLSPGMLDGGVRRFERLLTLTEAGRGWLLTIEYGGYLD